jgi:hypothetical protein
MLTRLWKIYALSAIAIIIWSNWEQASQCYQNGQYCTPPLWDTILRFWEINANKTLESLAIIAWPVAVSQGLQWVFRGLNHTNPDDSELQ